MFHSLRRICQHSLFYFLNFMILGACFLMSLSWGHNPEGESLVYLNMKENLWPLWSWGITKCSKNRKQINKTQFVVTFVLLKPEYWFSGVWPRSVEHAGLVTWVFPTDVSHVIYLSIFMICINKKLHWLWDPIAVGSNIAYAPFTIEEITSRCLS